MKRAHALGAAALIALGPFTAGALAAQAQPPAGERLAIVIGNAAYERAPLRNPVNDARIVAQSLRTVGFEVIARENAGYQPMVEAMREFLDRAGGASVRLIYFAGHGAQYRGKNYLIPTDVALTHEHELAQKAANATELTDKLARLKTGVNIVILDACREAAFPLVATRNPLRARTVTPGFAGASAPVGTLVAFSTSPGAIALDGPGPNSAYTRNFVRYLAEPGLPVEQLFKRVRVDVARETNQRQVPWESSSLMGDFCFRPGPDGACPTPPPGSMNPAEPAGDVGALARRR